MLVFTCVLLLVIDVLFVSFCADSEKPFYGIGGVLLAMGLMHLGLNVPVFPYILDNWQDALQYFVGYVLAGIPWAFFRWWLFAVRERQVLTTWLENNPMPVRILGTSFVADGVLPKRGYPVGVETADAFRSRIHQWRSHSPLPYNKQRKKYELLASRNKAQIITWMILWPFSMIGVVSEDVLIRGWDNLYRMLSGSFQYVSDWVFKDVQFPDVSDDTE